VGVGEFLGKLRSGNRYSVQIVKIPGELRAIAKSLFSPQKEIVFWARKSLITDIRAGARNSPFNFVSVYICKYFVGSSIVFRKNESEVNQYGYSAELG
jgi:hypothetical protein